MKKRSRPAVAMIGLLLFATVLYVAACSGPQPMQSDQGSSPVTVTLSKSGKGSDGLGDVDPFPLQGFLIMRNREANERGVTRAVIGPEGGVLIHGLHRIEISPGALKRPTLLTFTMPESNPDTLICDLGPDGIQFQGPVRLIVNFDHAYTGDLDETQFFMVVFNPDTGRWEPVASTVDTEANTVESSSIVTGSLKHFSRYCISKG